MTTLKDLIKKETMLVAAHSAQPGDISVAIEADKKETATWRDVATFTAPSAGSVEVTARGSGTGTSAIQIAAALVHTHAWTGTMLNRITIQASKGRTVTVAGQNFKELSVRFVKSIGGGCKRYLKALACNRFGGSLWLRLKTTSETLQKQEACLPLRREGGFLTRLLSTRVMECGGTKPLLQLASSLSSLSAQTSVTGISKTRLHMPILAGQLSTITQERATCHVTRAMRSRTTLGAQTDKPQTQVPLRSTSFLLSVASNNARMEVAA